MPSEPSPESSTPSALRRWLRRLAVAALLALGLAVALRPADEGRPHDAEMAALQAELQRQAPGRSLALLDLDALEANARLVRGQIHPELSLRLVTKSLPSMPLLRHLMQRLATDRLMAFSEPFLDALLTELGADADILLGRPLPAAAAARLIAKHRATGRVCWLVDHAARLAAYAAVAEQAGRVLRICIELDVGLRRGGVGDPAALDAILDGIAKASYLSLGGFMGYDGHVPHGLPALTDADAEFAAVHRRYAALVGAGRAAHPDLFAGPLIHDSGGSGTFARYGERPASPVDGISVGSAFLAPAHFPAARALGLRPAVLLAAPVLKVLAVPRVPFAAPVGPLLGWWDVNLSRNHFLGGGGWPADPRSPGGLRRNPLWDRGPVVVNLLPNQPLYAGSPAAGLAEGDFVFFDPWEGDAMVGFAELTLLSEGAVVGAWPTFRGGY